MLTWCTILLLPALLRAEAQGGASRPFGNMPAVPNIAPTQVTGTAVLRDFRITDEDQTSGVLDVSTQCDLAREAMFVTIRFRNRFDGFLYPKGYYRTCKMKANNEAVIVLEVSLKGCGTDTFVERSEQGDVVYYANTIVIMHQADEQILSHDDSAYRTLCAYNGAGERTVTSAPYNVKEPRITNGRPGMIRAPACTLKVVPGVEPSVAPVDRTFRLGEMATLVVMLTNNANFDLFASRCFAHDGMNSFTTTLVDENGCPNNEIVFHGGLKKNEVALPGKTTIYANFRVFKFPDVPNVYFECICELCINKCQRSPCGKGVDAARMDSSMKLLTRPLRVDTARESVHVGNAKRKRSTEPADEPLNATSNVTSVNVFNSITVALDEKKPTRMPREMDDHKEVFFDPPSFTETRQVAAASVASAGVCISRMSFAAGLSTMAVLLLLAITLAAVLWSKLCRSRLGFATSFDDSRVDSPFGNLSESMLIAGGTLRSTVKPCSVGSIRSQLFVGDGEYFADCGAALRPAPASLVASRKSATLEHPRKDGATYIAAEQGSLYGGLSGIGCTLPRAGQAGPARHRHASDAGGGGVVRGDELSRSRVGSLRSLHSIGSVRNPALLVQQVRQQSDAAPAQRGEFSRRQMALPVRIATDEATATRCEKRDSGASAEEGRAVR
ncbi:PREDICTED: uncharacterized protein LOC106804793 [Priapulus caudatus]|uniref:Uncharacterized protein LOC106804793 n=1 Tax=Priapulus caudatus TaxID=37621 RepID=A0ABM1DNV4_PRICU|nr:PREDICTED: uncharacterized protein LOC106804793 [Priapulus caudatus]